MISTKYAKEYCKEDIANIENYDVAVSDKDNLWECHHRRESIFTQKELKKLGEYYNRPAVELIFLPQSKHRTLIVGRKKSAQHRANISRARIGMKFSEQHKKHLSESHMGHKWTDEMLKKVSEKRRGTRWYNNGVKNVRAKKCPKGFTPGRLKRK